MAASKASVSKSVMDIIGPFKTPQKSYSSNSESERDYDKLDKALSSLLSLSFLSQEDEEKLVSKKDYKKYETNN